MSKSRGHGSKGKEIFYILTNFLKNMFLVRTDLQRRRTAL
jgi:hypothetical protein